MGAGAPRKGQGGHLTPLDFDINFSHIITVASSVEIQMHFWKGAKFAGSVGHPMTKMFSASGGLFLNSGDRKFCRGISIVERAINLAPEREMLRA